MASKSGNCLGSSEDQVKVMIPSFETTNADLFETFETDEIFVENAVCLGRILIEVAHEWKVQPFFSAIAFGQTGCRH